MINFKRIFAKKSIVDADTKHTEAEEMKLLAMKALDNRYNQFCMQYKDAILNKVHECIINAATKGEFYLEIDTVEILESLRANHNEESKNFVSKIIRDNCSEKGYSLDPWLRNCSITISWKHKGMFL